MPKFFVGLTGGFGSGKTTVLKMFKALGAKTLNCDEWVRECWKPRHPVYPRLKALIKSYGLIKGTEKKLPLPQVAREAFSNKAFRRKLEGIIHPVIFRKIRLARKREIGILVAEIPLLFETGFNRDVDFVITVKTSSRKSKTRVFKRHGLSWTEWKDRCKAQWSLLKKARLSDAVILNNGNLRNTKRQVQKIWSEIISILNSEKKGEKS